MNAPHPHTPTVLVTITSNGTCFVDDQPVPPPTDAPLNSVVLTTLQRRAASLGSAVQAIIRDDQAGYTTAIQVHANGSSVPLQQTAVPGPGEDVTDHPHEHLPEPYRSRLGEICACARRGRLAEAARETDELIALLSAQYGPGHLHTLAAGSVRGQIAWLALDHSSGWRIWRYLAAAWNVHLGAQHDTTIRAVSNAVACWRHLPPPEARAEADSLRLLLLRAPTPGNEQALRDIDQLLHPRGTQP
ncbi:hypothetical protein [Streptomyces sp. B6B3]|uniref:hypothetical protein n=1 Tax=Streptomyces sp. B6B3 TaxID=3153570 RepID=UPI00325D9E56